MVGFLWEGLSDRPWSTCLVRAMPFSPALALAIRLFTQVRNAFDIDRPRRDILRNPDGHRSGMMGGDLIRRV